MKLTEVYTSVQGEGPNTGALTQFVRFGGCNMRCPGWPCDTQFAIDPLYRHLWESVTPEDIVGRLSPYPRRICITGGEPLIQPSKQLEQFVRAFPGGAWRFDLFTNGSQTMPTWAFDNDVTVVMDWKLPGSGEGDTDINTRKANAQILGRKDAIKFVVADEIDLEVAKEATAWCYQRGVRATLWAGVAWGRLSTQELIDFVVKNEMPWKVNVQIHKYIWSPEERGV